MVPNELFCINTNIHFNCCCYCCWPFSIIVPDIAAVCFGSSNQIESTQTTLKPAISQIHFADKNGSGPGGGHRLRIFGPSSSLYIPSRFLLLLILMISIGSTISHNSTTSKTPPSPMDLYAHRTTTIYHHSPQHFNYHQQNNYQPRSASFTHSLRRNNISLLCFEQLLNEPNLDIAISKLTEMWKLVQMANDSKITDNINNSTLISSSPLEFKSSSLNLSFPYQSSFAPANKLDAHSSLPTTAGIKVKLATIENYGLSNRSRRWTMENDDNEMMSDDSTAMAIKNEYHENNDHHRDNNLNHSPYHSHAYHSYLKNSGKMDNSVNVTIKCKLCALDEHAKTLRIETIKMNILSKLNMDRAPNVSLKMLPKIPPINSMLTRLSNILNDDSGTITSLPKTVSKIVGNDYFGPLHDYPGSSEDEDEFFVNAEKSIVFAQKRMY